MDHQKQNSDNFQGLGGFDSPATTLPSEQNQTATPHSGFTANTYADTHQSRQEVSSLDSGAPKLDTMTNRGVNKKAVAFAAAMGGLFLIGTIWAVSKLRSNNETTVVNDEVVSIPDAPSVPASNLPPPPNPVVVDPNAKPIEVVPEPKQPNQTVVVNNNNPSIAPPIDPQLGRRLENAPLLLQGEKNDAPSAGGNIEKGSVRFLENRDAMIIRGTYLRCTLETRIITDVPGFASCLITEPVYSFTGHKLLLPKGSKVTGQYNVVPTGPRIGVIWDRVVTPNGFDVRLKSPGADNLGSSGHVGDYKSHWASRIGSAVMISLISDAMKYAAAEYGPSGSTTTTSTATQTNPYESTTAQTVQQAAQNALRNYAARPATVTINQGTIINIYTARDIDFSGVLNQ